MLSRPPEPVLIPFEPKQFSSAVSILNIQPIVVNQEGIGSTFLSSLVPPQNIEESKVL